MTKKHFYYYFLFGLTYKSNYTFIFFQESHCAKWWISTSRLKIKCLALPVLLVIRSWSKNWEISWEIKSWMICRLASKWTLSFYLSKFLFYFSKWNNTNSTCNNKSFLYLCRYLVYLFIFDKITTILFSQQYINKLFFFFTLKGYS